MEEDIASSCRALAANILSENDARLRMQHCRRALGLGRKAVSSAKDMSASDVLDVQNTLRLAYRASRGTCNPNAYIAKLAQCLMERAGIVKLPIVRATKPKVVGVETACLSLSQVMLPENWFEPQSAIADMNAEKFALMGVGADGLCSVCLRHIDGKDLYLEIPEYKKVIDVSPPMAIKIETGRIFFGAAEAVENGVSLEVENGRYICSVTSLRSGRYSRYLATLIRSDDPVAELHQVPEFRQV